jgi:hypothetical protein
MPARIVPMIHVPDVAATADWYVSIGFKVVDIGELDGEMSWALLSFGNSEIMLNEGGKASSEHRREFDLYIHVENVDSLCQFIKAKRNSWKTFTTRFTACVSSSCAIATASGSRLGSR